MTLNMEILFLKNIPNKILVLFKIKYFESNDFSPFKCQIEQIRFDGDLVVNRNDILWQTMENLAVILFCSCHFFFVTPSFFGQNKELVKLIFSLDLQDVNIITQLWFNKNLDGTHFTKLTPEEKNKHRRNCDVILQCCKLLTNQRYVLREPVTIYKGCFVLNSNFKFILKIKFA